LSAKLKRQIEVELTQLRALMDRHPQLLAKGPQDTLTTVEIDAIAALLHSFYTGVENLFKRIAVAMDGGPPNGEMSHTRLLDSMTRSTTTRGAVISIELRIMLRKFFDFRHMFRHAYSFELQWSKMAPIVAECETTFQRLKQEMTCFAEGLDDSNATKSEQG
jgi:hypothetical protein